MKNFNNNIQRKKYEIDIKLHFIFAVACFIISVFILNRYSYHIFKIEILEDNFKVSNDDVASLGEWFSFFFFKFSLLMYSIHHFFLGLRKYNIYSYIKKEEKEKQIITTN